MSARISILVLVRARHTYHGEGLQNLREFPLGYIRGPSSQPRPPYRRRPDEALESCLAYDTLDSIFRVAEFHSPDVLPFFSESYTTGDNSSNRSL